VTYPQRAGEGKEVEWTKWTDVTNTKNSPSFHFSFFFLIPLTATRKQVLRLRPSWTCACSHHHGDWTRIPVAVLRRCRTSLLYATLRYIAEASENGLMESEACPYIIKYLIGRKKKQTKERRRAYHKKMGHMKEGPPPFRHLISLWLNFIFLKSPLQWSSSFLSSHLFFL